MKKLKLALISGGISSEREVSLFSGDQVFKALDKEKYEIIRYDPKTDIPGIVLDAKKLDVALVILHGPFGEDGTIQGLLDLLDIPYQGSGVLGSAVAMNKLLSKILYEKAGLDTPPYKIIRKSESTQPDAIIREFGLPLVIKPVACGSSIGISIVHSEKSFNKALKNAFAHDNEVMIEAFIDGVEITGGVLGNDDARVLPLIEIVPKEGFEFFDYQAKYEPDATDEICPARINEELTQKMQNAALTAHKALFCRGYSRTDMILKDDRIFVLETNTIPGMTATSLFPQAAKEGGLDFSELLDHLIELAMEGRVPRKKEKKPTPRVSIVMGSDSDFSVMKETGKVLEQFDIPFEMTVASAHRIPEKVMKLASSAKDRGIQVIVAGAGHAAHLAGFIAAHTPLPVIGVPIDSSAFQGLDALMSTVQMPPGVPVATMAVGKTGARNAGIFAAQLLGVFDRDIMGKMETFKEDLAAQVEKKAEKLEKKLRKEFS